MLYRDPKCVFVANDFGQADVVAGWLQEHGIDAEVMNQATMGGMVSPLFIGATGIEVWVVDSAQAATAIQLLGEHAVSQLAKERTGPPLKVVCTECGKVSTFPTKQQGTVQECPHCAAYLDVEPEDEAEERQTSSELAEGEEEGRGQDAITDQKPEDRIR